jgi:hypothetical protein
MYRVQGYSKSHWTLPSSNYAPYCPVGCQGDKQQNDDEKYTYFAGRFDGHRVRR